MNHDDLVILTSWMADTGYDASEVADAVEKPWKWENELVTAREWAESDDDPEAVSHAT